MKTRRKKPASDPGSLIEKPKFNLHGREVMKQFKEHHEEPLDDFLAKQGLKIDDLIYAY